MTTLSKLSKEHLITDDSISFNAETNRINVTTGVTLSIGDGAKIGKTTILIVQNIGLAPVAVAFSSNIGISAAHAIIPVAVGAYNIYLVEHIVDGALVQLLADGSAGPFPSGADGGLIILNGETVTINAGDIKDYSSIDIQAGGLLDILDPADSWDPAEIYCTGTFNMEGTIQFRDTERDTTVKTGNFISGAPYSATTTQLLGGAGGNSSGLNVSGTGGLGTGGYGGGGAGGGCGGSLNPFGNAPANGGTGGSNNANGSAGVKNGNISGGCGAGSGGAGNSTQANGNSAPNGTNPRYGDNGGSGGGSGGGGGGFSYYPGDSEYSAGGGGGGGGQKGFHGGILHIFSIFAITGSGQINLSGTDAFNGGNGSQGQATASFEKPNGGGGGGAGSGGNGGHLYLSAPSSAFSIDFSGGAGGSGGGGGAGLGGGAAGASGGAGVTGNTGSTTNL